MKNLISISSSSFSIRLVLDPQFFCFSLKNCDHEVTSLAAHLKHCKNIGSISTFVDFPHSNDVSENLRDTHVADIMQYVNSLEERLNCCERKKR